MLRTCLTLLLCLAAVPAAAKDYRATRFDSRIEIQQGGALKVTETVVFTFVDGTFREVFRTIPTRRTDGIEFLSASMDGRVLPRGTSAGQVDIRRKNGLRVTWHFRPTSGATHTFELTYIARGVVREEDGRELLAWMALPPEHGYTIDASRVEVILPAEPLREAAVSNHRVDGGLTVDRSDLITTVRASNIRRNGRFTVTIPFPRGTVLDGPPAWQARQAAQLEKMPLWLAGGGTVFALSLMLLFALRQSDDHPPRERHIEWTSLIPPEQLPAAVGGALASNGQPQLQHAMAAIFSLADRGIVTIREEPRRTLGQRHFVVQRTRAGEHLSPHEEAVLDVIFAKASGAEASVSIAKARSYLTRHWSRVRKAILAELAQSGMTDPERIAHRHRYLVTGVALMMLAGVAAVACILLVKEFGGWPLLIPFGFVLGGLAAFIFMSAQTPLSNDGVRRADQWHAYKRHLKDPQGLETRWGASGPAEARILPYAVALGLASAWAKSMKKGRAPAPSWFHAALARDAGPAFSVFIATSGAGAHGGGSSGAGGGGAAGGGSSGAS
jgi:hypothetical protein